MTATGAAGLLPPAVPGGTGGAPEGDGPDLADLLLEPRDRDAHRRTRIAWLYHVEGRTQGEIAASLGLSRAKVNRELALARETGLVTVRIDGRFAGCVGLERRLAARFGLKEVGVVPTPGAPDGVPVAIGMAVAAVLAERLRPGMTVGIGWGRTLRWSVRAMPRLPVPGVTVVSLLGGLGRGSELNTYETASRLAEALDAACYYLAAPTFAGSARLRDMLLDEAGLRQVLERGRRADLAVVSVGSLGPEATMLRLGLLSEAERRSLAAAGAVGDLLGRFLDAEGRVLDHPLNRCAVGLAPEELRGVGTRLLASGGPDKVPAVRAALRAGYFDALVTDERTARALVEID